MKTKLKMVWFWVFSFCVIIFHVLKGNDWHMIYADFHFGDRADGRPIRKQLIAQRTSSGAALRWQDLSAYFESERKKAIGED